LMVDESAGLNAVLRFISDVKNTWSGCHPVLWVNQLTESDHLRAIQAGARGILSKTGPVESVIECLRVAGRGDVWMENQPARTSNHGENRRSAIRLTTREKEIVHHVCAGLKNKEIADALSITAGTVKVHLMHVFEKTGVKDRFELALAGRRLLGLSHSPVLSSRLPAQPRVPVDVPVGSDRLTERFSSHLSGQLPDPFTGTLLEAVPEALNGRSGMLPATVEAAVLLDEVSVE
jgi:DNA-binding NarL/FixJ family response regulator